MGRTPTKSLVIGKNTILVQVDKIRPTNSPKGDIRKVRYSPILLIKGNDDYLYIADGNHRFFKKLFARDQYMEAWVLEEGDQGRVIGDPLPQHVREWKEGTISLRELGDMAKSAYKEIRSEIEELLKQWRAIKVDSTDLLKGFQGIEERDPDVLALSLFNSILKIVKGTSSLEEQALVNNVGVVDLTGLYKCFMEDGIKAIRKKVRKRVKTPKKGGKQLYFPFDKAGPINDRGKQREPSLSHSGH